MKQRKKIITNESAETKRQRFEQEMGLFFGAYSPEKREKAEAEFAYQDASPDISHALR